MQPAPDPATTPQPSRIGYLLPSITDLVFVLLLASLTLGALAPRLLGDAGIGWHIRDGQRILGTHTIPRTDPFSVSMQGHAWYAWEWLYDLGIAVVHQAMGLNGVVLVSALAIALSLALAFHLALARGAGLLVALVALVMSAVTSSIHFLARPHVVGWLLTILWFWILDSAQRGGARRRLYWLPGLMGLWANLHGGFVTGFILLGIFLAAEAANVFLARDSQARRDSGQLCLTLAAVTALSALASLVNPYGYGLHRHVYSYLTNRFFMQHIDEFRGPHFRGLPEQFFLLLLLLTLAGIVAARARLRAAEWLLILFCASTGLYAARNLPVAAMLLMVVATPLFTRTPASRQVQAAPKGMVGRMRSFGERVTGMEKRFRGHLWPAAVTLAMLWICAQQGMFLGKTVMHAAFSDRKFPVRAVAALKARGNGDAIYTQDAWGGYVIYEFYPQVRTLVDDRHDLYGEPFLREYLKVFHAEPGWQQSLDARGVNLALMPAKSEFSDALRSAVGWNLTYEDTVAAVFERERGGGKE